MGKFNLKGIQAGVSKAAKGIAKHSPLILTVSGVVGLGATAVFAYKSAKKVEVIVDDMEERREMEERALQERAEFESKKKDMTPEERISAEELVFAVEDEADANRVDRMTVAKDIIGAVALPVTTGLLSVGAITMSYYILNNRVLGLAAALSTAAAERKYYTSKYKDTYGEEEYQKFMTRVEEETVKYTDEDGKEKEVKKAKVKQDIPSLHGEWFDKSTEYARDDHEYNMAFIQSVKESLELRMFRKGYLMMNEVYDALGLPRTKPGALIGWSTGTGFDLYPEVTNCVNTVTGEMTPQIYIKWTSPIYIYDNVEFEDVLGGVI